MENPKQNRLQQVLIYAIVCVPFMLIFDAPNVYWDGNLYTDKLVLNFQPKLVKGYKASDRYELKGTNSNKIFIISNTAFRQIKDDSNKSALLNKLLPFDTLIIKFPISDTNKLSKEPRVIGLEYRNEELIDPEKVYLSETKDFYLRFGIVLILFSIGIIWRYIDKRKEKKNKEYFE